MIVRLLHPQSQVVLARVPELHRAQMVAHREKYGRGSHSYDLPAIAWRQVLDHLLETCYGPLGGKLDSMPRSLYSSVKKISEVVMRMERHPALRGAAIEGWTGEVLPVWQDERRTSVYPIDGGVFGLLVPVFETNRDLDITRWVPGESPLTSWTFDEQAHLLFSQRPAAP